VPSADLSGLVQSFELYGSYVTYFFFSHESLNYLSVQDSAPSVMGEEGKVRASLLPTDLDDLGITPTLEAARHLTRYFDASLRVRMLVVPTVFHRKDQMDDQRQQREQHEIEKFSFVCHKYLRLPPPL
jgi:hypothetical protein